MNAKISAAASRPTGPIQFDCPGVLLPPDPRSPAQETWRWVNAMGEQPVTCRIAPPANLRSKVWRVHADLLPVPDGRPLVTSLERDDRLSPLALTPKGFCPVPGILKAVQFVIDSLEPPALRAFLADVFSDATVFEQYWRAHGAPDHHHWPGGLAVHAWEVAQLASRVFRQPPAGGPAWSSPERGVTLAAALLHDIGECTDDGKLLEQRFEAQRRLMELRHVELVYNAFSKLRSTHPALASALLSLLLPRQRFPKSGFRTDAMRQILLAAHKASVARGNHP